MADLCDETEGENPAEPDYSAVPFTTRREPIQDLIQSLSHLYFENEVDLDEHEDSPQYLPLPLPPPPQEENITTSNFESRVSKLEHRIDELGKSFGVFSMEVRHDMDKQNHQIQDLLTQQQVHHTKLQQLEKTLPTELKSECQQVKKTLEKSIQQVGQAMKDCMSRRDVQLKSLIQSSHTVTSTPHFSPLIPTDSPTYPRHFKTPFKLEFPRFESLEEEDPISYLEKCDEYLAVQPLSDAEILSMLPSVLTHTAKDWWIAEKKRVRTWSQFKKAFLQSFLPDDHEVEVERRIREWKQGVDENIRTFAYQYRALCLRLKPSMAEREILQAALRNCNPRISILRGTASTVDELVRVGTLVERDISEERAYWRQRQAEHQAKATGANKAKGRQSHHHIAVMSGNMEKQLDPLSLPISINNYRCQAVLDTGSTFFTSGVLLEKIEVKH